jgi:tetratricopeptide (TPR) repeat protein
LTREADNLRAALARGMDPEDDSGQPSRPEQTLTLALALYWFWQDRRLAEGRRWIKGTLAAATDVSPETRCDALFQVGYFSYRLGDTDAAERLAADHLRESEKCDNPSHRCRALWATANAARATDDIPKAIKYYELALALALERRIPMDAFQSMVDLGAALTLTGDYQRAVSILSEAVEMCRGWEHGTGRSELALSLLSEALVGLGNLDAAREAGEESLALARRVDWPSGLSDAVRQLARVAVRRGDGVWATTLGRESLDLLS